MLGGDHLLGAGGALAAAEAFDLGDAARGQNAAAPAAARELEHGPDEAEGAGLAGETARSPWCAGGLDEGAFEQVRGADLLAMFGRPAQVRDQGAEVVGDDGHRRLV